VDDKRLQETRDYRRLETIGGRAETNALRHSEMDGWVKVFADLNASGHNG